MPMKVTFRAIKEAQPGSKWQALFSQSWPGWRAWYVGRGGTGKPRLGAAVYALHRYMPELVPVWERLVELAGGDELAALFLTFWRPPAYLVHCSQAILLDHEGPFSSATTISTRA
jgi:hypothetical protein